jgi:hypothetical protein
MLDGKPHSQVLGTIWTKRIVKSCAKHEALLQLRNDSRGKEIPIEVPTRVLRFTPWNKILPASKTQPSLELPQSNCLNSPVEYKRQSYIRKVLHTCTLLAISLKKWSMFYAFARTGFVKILQFSFLCLSVWNLRTPEQGILIKANWGVATELFRHIRFSSKSLQNDGQFAWRFTCISVRISNVNSLMFIERKMDRTKFVEIWVSWRNLLHIFLWYDTDRMENDAPFVGGGVLYAARPETGNLPIRREEGGTQSTINIKGRAPFWRTYPLVWWSTQPTSISLLDLTHTHTNTHTHTAKKKKHWIN